MPRGLLVAILLIVAAPLAVLGWTSVRSLRNESLEARLRLESVFERQLLEYQQPIAAVFDRYERHLAEPLTGESAGLLRAIQELERFDPIVRSGLLVQPNGQLSHPSKPLTDQSRDLNHYASLTLLATNRPTASSDVESSTSKSYGSTKTSLSREPVWQSWYMDQGMQLVLWFPKSDGASVGILLERSRWIADTIAALPDSSSIALSTSTDEKRSSNRGYSTLVDEQQRTVYRWGEWSGDAPVVAAIDGVPPLASWKLRVHGNIDELLPDSASTAVLWALIATFAVIASLGAYVLTALQRQMKLAQNKVSFAGHVSHELRTPLTNIRLYADLAKRDLHDHGDSSVEQAVLPRLDVISNESERLSNLVSGVLEFMRGEQGQQRIKRSEVVPDDVIETVIDLFRPGFEAIGMEVERRLNAKQAILIDGEILRLVLVNLLGNVEKYAAQGKYVCLQSTVENGTLCIRVRDHGPGIASRYHRYVFKPFTRLDDAINAPSGTGIGLSIARSAAQRHGGTLTIEPSSGPGVCFLLKLPFF